MSPASDDNSARESDHVDDAMDEGGEEEDEDEEQTDVEGDHEEKDDKGGEGSQDGDEEGGKATATEEAKGPTAPLFSFPPGPRIERTKAEESLQVSCEATVLPNTKSVLCDRRDVL